MSSFRSRGSKSIGASDGALFDSAAYDPLRSQSKLRYSVWQAVEARSESFDWAQDERNKICFRDRLVR
jgi:hypothetical protein